MVSCFKVTAPPVKVRDPVPMVMAPDWSIELEPLFTVRLPAVRSIEAISIPSVESASVMLMFPLPLITVIAPTTFACSRVIAPPVNFKAPSSIDITPVWSIAFVLLSRVRFPAVLRRMEITSIPLVVSASVILIFPLPVFTVIPPRILS